MKPTDHYDSTYFQWQEAVGRFGGTAELIKFEGRIRESDNVIDFGCGGGFLLANLRCKNKLGVEINSAARGNCERLNVKVVETIADVPDGWADRIISNHALEHVANPFETISLLRSKLKPEGEIIMVVPCEGIGTKYAAGDMNRHLYTWSPINLGALFESTGYEVIECRPFFHRWIPKAITLQKILGWDLFHKASWIYGFIFRRLSQVRIVAKPAVNAGPCF